MRVLLICCVALCVFTHALASDIPKAPAWPRSIEIAGWHAEAIAIAVREFRKHQGGSTPEGKPVYGDLRHYSIHISRSNNDYIPLEYAHEDCVCITFAPEFSARDRRAATLGGRTDYGIEVSYDISKRGLKIIKTSFAR